MSSRAETKIEIIALATAAMLLASTMQVVPVWCGVMLAYIAYLRACGVAPVKVVERRGLTVVSLNISESMAFCLVMRKQNSPYVWQLQLQGAA